MKKSATSSPRASAGKPKKRVALPPAAVSRDTADFKTRSAAVRYVMAALQAIDEGKPVAIDFVSTPDVNAFCKVIGFTSTWAGKTIDEIAPKDGFFDVNVTNAHDAAIVLELLKTMVREGSFVSRDGSPFDKTTLNDYLPKSTRGFQGKPTWGHFWEFRYALAVELEHGRTRGTNVTNNHPLLTGMVVMAHILEDKLYYARLLCMEAEGDLSNLVLAKKPLKEIGTVARKLEHARVYLGSRLKEKLEKDFELPV